MAQGNAGPIPGANYTSDTKNYPWRQPPEFTDLDEALDYMAKRLTQFKVANGVLTMAELGLPLYKITSMILTMGMGEGKWTADYMLLMAGPVTRMIELMCIGFEVEYDLGIYDDEENFTTGDFFKKEMELKGNGFKILEEAIPEIKEEAEAQNGADGEPVAPPKEEESLQMGGFMAMQGAPSEPEAQEGE